MHHTYKLMLPFFDIPIRGLRCATLFFSFVFSFTLSLFGSFDTRQVFKIYCYVFMLSFVTASSSCSLVPHTHSRMQTHHIQLKSKITTEFIAQIWCRLVFVCRGVMAQVSPYSIQNNEIKRFVSSTRPNFVCFYFFLFIPQITSTTQIVKRLSFPFHFGF